MTTPDAPYIIQETITTQIDGQAFDFLVKATTYGEVLDVQSLFLELPEEARQMMLGAENAKRIEQKLNAYSTLLHYKIPAIRLGIATDDDLSDFIVKLKTEHQKLRKARKLPRRVPTQHLWTKVLMQYVENTPNPLVAKQLQALGLILSKENPIFRIGEAYKLVSNKKTKFNMAGPILLPSLIYLEPNDIVKDIYKALAGFPKEHHKAHLKADFIDATKQRYRREIIIGMYAYYKDLSVHRLLTDYVKNSPSSLSSNELDPILRFLSAYRTKEVEEIAWNTVLGNRMFENRTAFYILKKNGHSERKIVSRIITKLTDETISWESRQNFQHQLNLCEQLTYVNNKYFLPDGDVLMSIIRQAAPRNIELAKRIGRLIAKKYDFNIAEQLYQMLLEENTQSRALEAIYEVYCGQIDEEMQVPFTEIKKEFRNYTNIREYPMPDKMYQHVIGLMTQESEQIRKKAMDIICTLHIRTQDISILNIFLKQLKEVENPDLHLMNKVHELVAMIAYDKVVNSVYLPLLQHENKEVRLSAIKTLKHSEDKKILQRILAIKEDSYDRIRKDVAEIKANIEANRLASYMALSSTGNPIDKYVNTITLMLRKDREIDKKMTKPKRLLHQAVFSLRDTLQFLRSKL